MVMVYSDYGICPLMSVGHEEFRKVMSQFVSGVTVVTTVDNTGKMWGATVSAFSSLSMDPPLCLVCLDHRSESLSVLRESKRFAVNFLNAQQADVSNQFARPSDDKFKDIAWTLGSETGCPLLSDALAGMECDVHEMITGGDHDIIIGRLRSTYILSQDPLLYWNGNYGTIASRMQS